MSVCRGVQPSGLALEALVSGVVFGIPCGVPSAFIDGVRVGAGILDVSNMSAAESGSAKFEARGKSVTEDAVTLRRSRVVHSRKFDSADE